MTLKHPSCLGMPRAMFIAALMAAYGPSPWADANTPTDLVNLGTNTFTVATDITSASYSQDSTSVTFDGTYALGDLLAGTFDERDWSAYGAFGLRMTLEGTNPDLPFTVEFFDPDFNVINAFQGTTSESGALPSVTMLSLSLKGTDDFSRVVGMQLTWDGPGEIDTSLTEVVGFAAPDGGFFVIRAPGGVNFTTGTNPAIPYETTLSTNATNWSPPTFAASLPPNSASWAMLSDGNAKTDICTVDHRETLHKLSELPVTAWRYKHDPARPYFGPMAQDFHATFGLGNDTTRISTIDTDGVTLSALKGLIAELQDRKARSAAQDKRLAELEAELQALSEKLRGNLPPAE